MNKTDRRTDGHPRLYMTSGDLPGLKALRQKGHHALIWKNIKNSSDWCLERTPRKAWIAPVSPDPIYENLYDRFYAMMADLAITEHLAFAYALSGEKKYGKAARAWVLASCRVWQREADGGVDGGKAYAVSRILKGIAVGYDLVFDLLSEEERAEIRNTLVRIGQMYYTDYFNTPEKTGPDFHTHHATVEFASLGVVALALLGEVPEAQVWLNLTIEKFEQHLLPYGLASDGAHVEGATFWASTMQYRLFFMDPLRRVTGYDLFTPFKSSMNADLALATIACMKQPGQSADHETVILQPSYGQLDYCAPVLLGLARAYRQSTCQKLALWDQSLGHLQQTRYVTPNGEPLLFELGGYAYVWYDPSVDVKGDERRKSWHFHSTDEAYIRASWRSADIMAGVNKHQLIIHAGGHPVVIGGMGEDSAEIMVQSVRDTGEKATIQCAGSGWIELHRPNRAILCVPSSDLWAWTCQGQPTRSDNTLTWPNGILVHVVKGTIKAWEPNIPQDEPIVGNGRLRLQDVATVVVSRATIEPAEKREVILEIIQP
jgi:hypothetical protein